MHVSGIARTAVSFSGDILNNSESNKTYLSDNVSNFFAMSLRCMLEWFILYLHSKLSFIIDFSLIFYEIHYFSLNSGLFVLFSFDQFKLRQYIFQIYSFFIEYDIHPVPCNIQCKKQLHLKFLIFIVLGCAEIVPDWLLMPNSEQFELPDLIRMVAGELCALL